MCRLFGLHSGSGPVTATFWLLDAPDSLSGQSHRNPDGAGIGVFDPDGVPRVDKQPIAAWDDVEFAAASRELTSRTFVAHVRHASTGAHTLVNTHPFEQRRRLFAHNGVVGGLDLLDQRLAEFGATHLVHGDTDSERVFALITAEAERHAGDLAAGLIAAVSWISAHVPVFALNCILTTPTELWALRYPDRHELWILERPAGGGGTTRHLDARTDRIHARSAELANRASVIVASERMDDDPGWRLLEPGELVVVGTGADVHSSSPFPATPSHLLTVADLDPAAAASQKPTP